MKASRTVLVSLTLVALVSGCAGAGVRSGSYSRDQVPATFVENQLVGTWRGSFSQLEASLYEDEGNCVLQIWPDGTFAATMSKAKLGTNNLAKPESFSGTVVPRGNRVMLVTAQGPRLTLMRRGDSLYTVTEDPTVEAPIVMSLRHVSTQVSQTNAPSAPSLQ
jgi:hypothetical protein